MEGGVVLHSILPPDPIVVLDSVVQDLQKSADKRSGVLHKSSRGLTSFLLSILRELREIICGKGKKPKPLGKEAHAAVSALAALLLRVDGIADTARKKIKSTTGVSQMLARRVAGEQEEAASQDSRATRLPVESRPDHSW